MDTLKELAESILQQMRDRVANPLVGAFVLAWTVWNFNFILVVVGDGGWERKIAYINSSLYGRELEWLFRGVLSPLVSSIIFVLAYPFVNRWVLAFHRSQQKKTFERLLIIEDTTPLTKEAADRLRQRIKLREIELNKEISDLREANEDLTEALKRTKEDLNKTQENIKSHNGPTPDLNESIKAKIVDYGGAPDSFAEEFQMNSVSGRIKSLSSLDSVKIDKRALFALPSEWEIPIQKFPFNGKHLAILYAISSGDGLEIRELGEQVKLSSLSLQTFVEQLVKFELIKLTRSVSGDNKFGLTSMGRQVLFAALNSLGVSAV